MTITNVLASVGVNDLSAATRWYARLFGRPADSTAMADVAEWKFDGGGWLQVYASSERAGFGSFTVTVSSLDDQIVALRALGIDPGNPAINDTVKVVMIKDPDGNSIAFSEAVPRR